VRLWTNRYNGTANNYDNAAGIAVDAAGDVFVTGASYGSDSTFDYATIKYSGAGLPLWTNRYSALGGESPVALGVDSSGNVFVTGSSSAGCTTLKYSSASEVLWLSRSGPRTPSAAAIDAGGNFIVAGSDDLGGQDYVTVKICSESAPANDTFSDRIVLSGFRIFTNANNDCASREPGEPSHAGNAGGKSLWWSWPALASGPVTVNTCGSSFDSLLAVYTGNAVNALTPVASNNDSLCSGDPDIQSEVQFNAVAGTTYQIAVDGFKYPDEPGARAGQINLTISPTRAPLAVSGWNMDVVMENDGAPYAKNFDFYYQQFEGLNGACWFESGLGGHADGLPATRMLANALNSNVVFELQPYDTNNVLRLDLDPGEESGSLTLASRGRYSTIYVLAASGRTGSGPAVGSVVLHFTDGSSSAALPFNAPDWLATSPGLAISRLGRSLSSGTNFVYEYVGATGFGLYQSEINLAGLGLSGKFLQSLTFTKPGGNSSPETTGIFAISGLRAPP